jgi:hypothetical protein
MTLIGTRVQGAVAQALTADRVVGSSLLLPSGLIAQFTADVDGQRGFTPQLTRVVVYRDATAGLVAVSEPVVIETGQARGWVNYPFSSPLLIAAEESYFVGLQAGGGDAGQGWGAASGGVGYADAYADGPLASRPAGSAAGTVALFATYFQGWVPPTIPDEELAAYGWLSAQRAFGAGSAGAAVSGRAEWHDTGLDEREGAFALVREGGPLEGLVGDRVKVEYAGRSCVVYVVDSTDELDDTDLSLARRAWMALTNPSVETIEVQVRVMSSG